MILLPDIGDFYRIQPKYNSATVAEILQFLGAKEVIWASGTDPDHPLRDALPATKIGITENTQDWSWADKEKDELVGFLNQYPQGRDRLRQAANEEYKLSDLLSAALLPSQVVSGELLLAAQDFHNKSRELLDEGPGTLWRERRLRELAKSLEGRSGVVLAALDDIYRLMELLPNAKLPELEGFLPQESSRLRALTDRAWQLNEQDDLGAVLESLLRENGDAITPKAELDSAAANIYLAVGEIPAARQMLEKAAHSLTDDLPRSIAGLVLARLGQVRDIQGERDLAIRTYKAVKALRYAPSIALETAKSGLELPFALD